jgi:hypothetical protein
MMARASFSDYFYRASGTEKIRLGICAMDKKARSKEMGEILRRLPDTEFEKIFFGFLYCAYSLTKLKLF